MNLAAAIKIYAGGPGSGCNGPSCGRPAKKAGTVLSPETETKTFNKKNMHDMAKVLQSHDFVKQGNTGARPGGAHAGPQYGQTARWERMGKQEVADPNNTMRLGEKFRKHSVLVSPAGWSHSSEFKDYQTHGRGLSADSLDKHLKEHGL